MYFMRLNIHAKRPLHCPIFSRDIFEFVFLFSQTLIVTSSVPNLHDRENVNISGGEEEDIKKENHHPSSFESLLKKAHF